MPSLETAKPLSATLNDEPPPKADETRLETKPDVCEAAVERTAVAVTTEEDVLAVLLE
jgi:hypothetical protein